MDFIFDSSSLIYFGKINLLGKIALLKGRKLIPKCVYEEVITKGKERKDEEIAEIEKLIENKLFTIKNVSVPHNISDNLLSNADKEVLGLAKQINGVAIMDEEQGRNFAKYSGINYHGSIYLLLQLVKEKIITKNEAVRYIDKMIDIGFYLSVDKYREVIKTIKGLR